MGLEGRFTVVDAHSKSCRRRTRGAVAGLIIAIVGSWLPTGISLGSPLAAHASSSNYSGPVLADHPSAYYRLNEAAGPTAADSSGHSVTAQYQANVTYSVPGGILSDSTDAAVGSGTGGVLTTAVGGLPTGNSPRTYEFWLNGTQLTPNGSNAVPILTHGDVGLYYLTWNGDRFGNNQICGTCGGTPTAQYSIHDGVWHMMTATWDGVSTMTYYVDGQTIGTQALAPFNTAPNASLVLASGYSANYDELAVYPTALSAGRVSAHWTAGGSKGTACATPPNWGYAQTVLAARPSLYLGLRGPGQGSDRSRGL